MFYTFLLLDCDTAIPGISICTARESYRFVYALVRGETLVEEGEWSRDATILVSVFLVVCMLWLAAVLLNIVNAALRLDPEQVALSVFWEPQLATTLAFGLPHRKMDEARPMERFWNILTNQRDDDDYEHKASGRTDRFLLRFLSIFAVPLWILIGAVTLGWLWPPQVREWIFRPKDFEKTFHKIVSDTPIRQLRQEVHLLKIITYEKAMKTEHELRHLRELLQTISTTASEKGPAS